MKLSILELYLVREVLRPFLVVSVLLVLIFASFDTARVMADAMAENFGMALVLRLVALRAVISLDVLLPVAFYLAVVIGLGRLYNDSEIIALQGAGFSDVSLLRSIALLAIPLAMLVAILSLQLRPWAYDTSYTLRAQQGAEVDLEMLSAGRFHGSSDGDRIIHFQSVDPQTNNMLGFMSYAAQNGGSEIVLAAEAEQTPRGKSGDSHLVLRDGVVYQLQHHDARDRITTYATMTIQLHEPEVMVSYRRKAADNASLYRSSRGEDIAELQWRLSRPLVTLLLAFTAVPLSRAAPRRGRHSKIVTALLVFIIYFAISDMARSWVEQEQVAAFPGIWWAHALMACVFLILLYLPQIRLRLGLR